jgi:hypothetical protein
MITDSLVRRPFTRIRPDYYTQQRTVRDPRKAFYLPEKMLFDVVSQSDFLREYYPTGHKINSQEYYPDKVKYDDNKKQYFKESVFRACFPLQMIITAQQLVHLCGNDIRHELTNSNAVPQEENDLFLEFQKGWLDKNIDIKLYDFFKSVKITGDAAMVMYMYEGKVYTKVLSFLNGDTSFPHYDGVTGKLDGFARQYYDYDEESSEKVSWVEMWDDTYMRTYRMDMKGFKGAVNKVKSWFNLEGYSLVKEERHNFNRVPVIYHRDEIGACWSPVQDAIDKYELAISHLCQNNMAYAFPIMILKGEDIEIQGDMYGAVKAITMGQDDDASFLNRENGTTAFELQINTLLKMIFMGAFIVMPPEVKSGDLPGVAIKLIYSPSLERALLDAKEYDHVIDELKELFLYGYGIETGKLTKMLSLNILSYIVPYVHQNTAELINNLVSAVNSNILSKETASEQTTYDKNNEFDRIMREMKEEQSADLLAQITTKQSQQAQNVDNE